MTRSSRRDWTILVIDAGYFLTREVVSALKFEGHRVLVIPLNQPDDESLGDFGWYDRFLGDITDIIKQERPDALFTINHLGFDCDGRMTDLLETHRLPALVWYVDSPRYILLNHHANVSDKIGIFLWEEAYEPWLREIGYDKVDVLPLATDPSNFNDEGLGRHQNDVSFDTTSGDGGSTLVFVGDSMHFAVAKAFAKLPPHLRPDVSTESGRQVAELTTQFCDAALVNPFHDKRPAWDILQGLDLTAETQAVQNPQSSSPAVGLLECAVDTEQTRLNLESAMVLMATRLQRNRLLKKISNSFSTDQLVVYGDQGWEKILNGTSQVLPPVHYYDELPAVYRRAGTVLNATSFQMPTALNQRCYDVPVSGGFLLTDAQPTLCEQFEPDKELVCFESIEDLRDKWNYFKKNPAQRRAVIEGGRRRVLSEHTYRHRIRKMLATANTWYK
jgi:spore maturation protein CgeB